MPLYELVLIVKNQAKTAAQQPKVKQMHKALLKACGMRILDNKGVLRSFTNLGFRTLPYRMKRHQEIFSTGNYYAVKFDSSPKFMQELHDSLKTNEYVIRHTTIKLGDSLKTISDYNDPKEL